MKEEKPFSELKLSEMVEQSLKMGVVPQFAFMDIEKMTYGIFDQGYNAAVDDALKIVKQEYDQWGGGDSPTQSDFGLVIEKIFALKKNQTK